MQDESSDRKTDQGIGDGNAQGDESRAENNAGADEAVGSGVVAIRDYGRTVGALRHWCAAQQSTDSLTIAKYLRFCSSVRACEHTCMSPVDHAHPINAAAVEQAQRAVLTPEEAERLGRLLSSLSDPVRLRILFALVSVDELCVGDVAMSLDVSMDQASYGLRALRSAGLVQTRRDGRVIYYRLAAGFPHQLLEHCLHQLLTISAKEGR